VILLIIQAAGRSIEGSDGSGNDLQKENKHQDITNKAPDVTSEAPESESSTFQNPEGFNILIVNCPKNRVNIDGHCRPKSKML
jgi:hypothetical protein